MVRSRVQGVRGHCMETFACFSLGWLVGMDQTAAFVFTRDNFRRPKLPSGLTVVDVPLEEATDDALKGR